MPRPLDCQQVLERLEAYVDGDLDRAPAAAIAAHLEACPGCAFEHRLAADVRRELRASPAFDAPPAVLREVLRQVGAERFRPPIRTHPPPWAALARPAVAAAALAAAVIGGGLLLTLHPTTSPEPPTAELAPADPEEVARATEEARLAFAQVARVSRQAGFRLRDDLGEHLLVAPSRSLARALLPAPEPDPTIETEDRERHRS